MQRRAPVTRDTARLYALVALGSAIGGTLRGAVSLALAGTGLPWATLIVNMLGSFAIGLYAALAGPGGRLHASPGRRQFVMTGLCGGFTTFSVFSLDALRFLQNGQRGAAALFVVLSVTTWLAAVWLGDRVARRLGGAMDRER